MARLSTRLSTRLSNRLFQIDSGDVTKLKCKEKTRLLTVVACRGFFHSFLVQKLAVIKFKIFPKQKITLLQ
jgi:hypothetical protein